MPERVSEKALCPDGNRLAAEPAIRPEEWASGVIQRGRLALLVGDGDLTLMESGDDGTTQIIRVEEGDLMTLAAAALALLGLVGPRDADDGFLATMILERYAAGASRDTLPAPLREELEGLIDRRLAFARKIDALAQRGRGNQQEE